MKVILLQDVAKLGRRFDIVDVPSGHALNRLIPQGIAEEATKNNIKKVESRAEKTAQEREATGAAFSEALLKSKETEVSITVNANEQGHLFEALKSVVIAESLNAAGLPFGASQIHVKTPIKEVGEHTIDLSEGDVSGEVTIIVVAK